MIALQLAGCALTAGAPWVELAGGTFAARFEPGARAVGDGEVVTDTAARFRLDVFEIEVTAVDLEELQGAGGVEFDPANPPEGYSLCHGGHCHAADGALVDYSEIVAELAGGRASLVTVAGWPVDDPIDLRAGAVRPLGQPEGAALPQVTLTRAVVRVAGGRIAGELRPDGGEAAPFDLTLGPLDVSADLGFEVGLDAPPRVRLEADWPIDGTLFDGLDVATLAGDGTLPDAIARAVPEALSLQPLSAALLEAR